MFATQQAQIFGTTKDIMAWFSADYFSIIVDAYLKNLHGLVVFQS